MNRRAKHRFGAMGQTTLRRLRTIPTYFFLIWRWTWWLYAAAWIVLNSERQLLLLVLLAITFIQTLLFTLYAPIFQLLMPGRQTNKLPNSRRTGRRFNWMRDKPFLPSADEELDALPPVTRSSNVYKNIVIYSVDVIICGLVTYLSAVYWHPPFGDGSPFYRYGFSTIFAAAFAYGYRGGLAAALGYDLFMLLGAFFPPMHPPPPAYTLQVQDLLGSLFDAPLIAVLAAYMSSLLSSYTRSRRGQQDSARRQKALRSVGETLLAGSSDRRGLLQRSIEEIRRGAHFERMVIALMASDEDGKEAGSIEHVIEMGVVEAVSPEESRAAVEQVARSGEKLHTFTSMKQEEADGEEVGLARLYLPIFKDEQVYLVLGGERQRNRPFDVRQENFLKIAGTQLVMTLENIRLTEQTAELAAAAERGRIAREIHDGVAQLIYMLSLQSETCAALVQRISGSADEETGTLEMQETLAPVEERLEKVITLSKQALWETRHYMFTLKPLILGTSTLTQMLRSQLHEFESISGLPVRFEVEGEEEGLNGDNQRARKQAQVGTAIFRITQEALTNAYKHAHATELQVYLRLQPQQVEIEICDDGKGMPTMMPVAGEPQNGTANGRFYSGHGMRGMRERAEELGGTFELSRKASGGLSVLARIPL